MKAYLSYKPYKPYLNYSGSGIRTLFSWLSYNTSLEPDGTLTRASTAYVLDHEGKYWLAAANWPRFNGARIANPQANGQLVYYNTTAGSTPIAPDSINLLMEPVATNLLTYSETMSNGIWVKYNSTVTDNVSVDPAGGNTADKLVEDTTLGGHYVTRSIIPATGYYTFSVHIKAAGRSYAMVQCAQSGATSAALSINLTTGALLQVLGTFRSSSALALTNGWWRVTVTYESLSTATLISSVYNLIGPAYADRSYTGDGTSGVYVWGAQIQIGEINTSYIPTTTVTVTRAVDALSYSGVPADNETRFVVNGASVDVNDWNGIYPTPTIPNRLNSISVYNPLERPA